MNPLPTTRDVAPQYSYLNRDTPQLHRAGPDSQVEGVQPPDPASDPAARDFAPTPGNNINASSGYLSPLRRAASRPNDSTEQVHERSPLLHDASSTPQDTNDRLGLTRYGSIIGSPPQDSSRSLTGRGPPSLDLPGPALRTTISHQSTAQNGNGKRTDGGKASGNQESAASHRTPLSLRHRSIFHPKRMNSDPHMSLTTSGLKRPITRRLFSLGAPGASLPGEFPMAAYKDVDVRQGEFFNFLDLELEKVEDFYRQKEDDASKRLEVLRQQLHIMRDRRLEEILQARQNSISAKRASQAPGGDGKDDGNGFLAPRLDSIRDKLDETVKTIKYGKIGQRSKALETLSFGYPSREDEEGAQEPWNRDYVRKVRHSNISYHAARRKLKVAMQEYYRGLELLKSYALLNQKAFRKMNKKYDKAVNARPSLRYMNEKVNTAYFVTSDVVDGHIRTVEDLYARYFEGGNHKVAAGKLRAKSARHGDYTSVVFRNGIYLALGAVFGVEGLVKAGQILEGSSNGALVQNTSYLLQVRVLQQDLSRRQSANS